MFRSDLLKCIRHDGPRVVEQVLPSDARAELNGTIRDRRHKIDENAFLMFVSIRAVLRESEMVSCELNLEVGQIMHSSTFHIPSRYETLRAGHRSHVD